MGHPEVGRLHTTYCTKLYTAVHKVTLYQQNCTSSLLTTTGAVSLRAGLADNIASNHRLYKTVHSCSCTHHNFVAVMYTGTEQGPLAAHNVTLYQLYTFSPNRRRRRRPACVPRRPSQARPPTRRPTRRPGRMPAGGGGVRKGNTTALYEFSLYNASDYNDPTRRSGRRPPRGLGKVSGRPTRRQVGPEDASWPTHSGENAARKG